LLKLADVTSTPDARDALVLFLQSAWATNRQENLRGQSAPAGLFKQLENSIKKTQRLLRRLRTFPPTEDIEFDMFCYLATQKGFPRFVRRNPPINRQRVLDGLMRDLDRAKQKRKRGGQRNLTHQAVVAFAGEFFRQYSTANLTTYPGGKFVPFCKLFYEIATGAPPLDDYVLDTQIKAEVKSPQLGAKWIKS
jgi:hypothetical protein